MERQIRVLVCIVGVLLLTSSLVLAKPAPVPVPSINDQTMNSPLGSRHWNIFRNTYNNPEDPEQSGCIKCHSAVAIVDDPDAKLTDFLKAGDEYCYDELDNPAPGQSPFLFTTATETGKYVDNDFEGITCRVCHIMDKNGLTLRRPDNTCTLCHGREFRWARGSGKHVEQAFFEGQGEGYWDPSVHYTIGMQCEDCHTMNSIKHDYEPAKPEDIVKDALCLNCHYSAEELAEMIETTQARVTKALGAIDARIQAAEAAASSGKVAADKLDLVQKAKARVAFIRNDFSDGVHNPQFAAKLINEANSYLDQFDKALGKTTNTAAFDLSDLSVYSQAQTSSLGNRHWDMLERTIFNPEDPDQDGCIKCHSAVAIVDDPNAKVADFLAAGQKYCYEELDDAPAGQSPFLYTTAEVDGKYLKNRIEGITCRVCHVFGEDGNIGLRRTEEQTCGLCHGRNFRWDRGSGKHVELAFMRGQGAPELGIADMPSSKYAMGFACQSCHFMDTSKHDFEAATPEQIAANSQCSPCHSAKEIGNRIAKIQKDVSSALAKLNPRLEKALAYVEKNPKNTKANDLYAQAKACVTFVENDFSNGVHNPDFATMLLERSAKLLTQFEAEFK